MSRVSVVILNWNGKKLLQEYLPSVIEHSREADVIVADNASTDDSISFLRENFSSVQIIRNDKNYGFAEGYNRALKEVGSEYYILLNSDVEVTPGWIAPLIQLLQSSPEIAVVQPRIRALGDKKLFEYAGAAGGFIDKWGYPFCRGRLFNDLEEDNGQYEDTMEIFWATGACMAVKSELFHRLGGFDGRFFAHMEEIDLCWRIKNAGYKIYCEPKSVVYHLGGGTLNKLSPGKTYLNFRNNLMMMIKNLPQRNLFSIILVRLVLDGIAAIRFLFEKNGFKHFIAVAKAHFYIYGNYNSIKQKRKEVSSSNSFPSAVYKKNIVFQHFLLGMKKFSDLDKKDFT